MENVSGMSGRSKPVIVRRTLQRPGSYSRKVSSSVAVLRGVKGMEADHDFFGFCLAWLVGGDDDASVFY